ncbi:MAG: methyl-accepting chemotaxis protein [Mycobacterium leprae]
MSALIDRLSANPADLLTPVPGTGSDQERVNQALAQLRETFLIVEESVQRSGITEARARLDLETLRQTILQQSDAVKELLAAIDDVAGRATEVAAAAETGSSGAANLKALAGSGQQALDTVSGQLGAVVVQAKATQAQVEALLQEVAAIGRIADAVSRVANQTNLLSLNAAIEAARAGQQGRGFAVVAQEIRKLADQAAHSAREITSIVERSDVQIRQTSQAVNSLAQAATDAAGASGRTAGELGQMFHLVDEVASSIGQTAEVAISQAALAEEMAAVGTTVGKGIEQMANLGANLNRRQSSTFVEKAEQALARYRYGGRSEFVLDLGLETARALEERLEAAVRGNRVRVEDLLDTDYVEIKGALRSRLSHLFDVRRVPESGFTPPKYGTRGDHLVDADLRTVLDHYMAVGGKAVISMGVVDLNGFAVAFPSFACQDWTGDSSRDLLSNRVKRIFDDPVGLRGARVGLAADAVPQRASRSQFARAGVDLEHATAPGTFLAQTYARDTGTVSTDIAIPLHVLGRRFGALRVGITLE